MPPTIAEIIANWLQVTGHGDHRHWTAAIGKEASRRKWGIPLAVLKGMDLGTVVAHKRTGVVGDPFMGTTAAEQEAIVRYLARRGVPNSTLKDLFSQEVMGNLLDLNEPPEAQSAPGGDAGGGNNPPVWN